MLKHPLQSLLQRDGPPDAWVVGIVYKEVCTKWARSPHQGRWRGGGADQKGFSPGTDFWERKKLPLGQISEIKECTGTHTHIYIYTH